MLGRTHPQPKCRARQAKYRELPAASAAAGCRRSRRWPCLGRLRLLVCLLGAIASILPAQTRYEIDLAEAASGWLSVTAETVCKEPSCEFQLPVWNATYQVRDFAQYIRGFQAVNSQGRAIAVQKAGVSSWRLAARAGEQVQVRYRVEAKRPGPFGAFAGPNHICLNLAQVLAYPAAQRRNQFTLGFHHIPSGWKTAITLGRRQERYVAGSYDELTDTPVHMSPGIETSFDHAGRRIRIFVDGLSGRHDLAEIQQRTQAIVSAATGIMGDTPFSSYTFVYHLSGEQGGGMEYRDGAVIYMPASCRDCDLSSITAHEFFHAWNVKRIRPQSLEPSGFRRPAPTPSLWFCEGVTSTYAQFIRLRAGLLGAREFLDHLGRLITEYEARPANRQQSAETSSIEAWLERDPGYASPDRSVSYYLQGELIGYLLDLVIRHRTQNSRGLDDVMRLLNRDYGQAGRYYQETAALERAATEIAGSSMKKEFDRLVRTPAVIPWKRYLGFAGLRVKRKRHSSFDPGLSISGAPGAGSVVSSIVPGSAAGRAGFRLGDHITAIDGEPFPGNIESISGRLQRKPARPLRVTIERKQESRTLELLPRLVRASVFRITRARRATAAQEKVRQGWLRNAR